MEGAQWERIPRALIKATMISLCFPFVLPSIILGGMGHSLGGVHISYWGFYDYEYGIFPWFGFLDILFSFLLFFERILSFYRWCFFFSLAFWTFFLFCIHAYWGLA